MRRTLALAALLVGLAAVAAVVVLATRHGKSEAMPPAAPAAPSSSVATPSTTVTPSAPLAGATLRAASFATEYPSGWSATTRTGPRGSVRHQLSSTGAKVDGLDIPPAGTVGVTIDEFPSSGVVHGQRVSLAGHTATALLAQTVGTPRGASEVTLAAGPRSVLLAGAPAAEEAYSYKYGGRRNVQVDLVAAHGARIVLVELDAQPGLARSSQTALELLTARWRWR